MMDAARISKLSVYPPLGIARVGNSMVENGWYLASEVAGRPADLPVTQGAPGRDDAGHILRQAVRFRVYAHLDDGQVVEIKAGDNVKIEWTVTVANLKAGWYQFLQAMDLPPTVVRPASRRNALVTTSREQLDVVPSTRTISGTDVSGAAFAFDDGRFFGAPVYLGELQTDSEGRLVFLGGRGHSSARVPGTRPTTFANNDDWHDDVCDGPVRATANIGGTLFEAEPGYVVVAPPNYAPGLFGVVTMEDTVRETWIEAGWVERPTTSSFTRDIWPIFDRMCQMAWVNHGLHVALGDGSPLNAREAVVIAQLRDPSAPNEAWRQRVFGLFLAPTETAFEPGRLPQVFGDGYGETGESLAIERLSVTRTMYAHLERWRDGQFQDDWPGTLPEPPVFHQLSPGEQVSHLERAALYECLGGPFHPGIEMTWPLRDRRQWVRPYRLAVVASEAPAVQDYGERLTRSECMAPGGPLDGVAPGSMTRWLGIPWQTDEASCNSDADYAPSLFLSMPSFWGARVPEQVLSNEAFSRAVDDRSPVVQRRKHFDYREDWLRDIRGLSYQDRITAMVSRWWQLGIVAPQQLDASPIYKGLDQTAWVETGRPVSVPGSNAKVGLVAAIEQLNAPLDMDAGLAPSPDYRPPRIRFGRGEV